MCLTLIHLLMKKQARMLHHHRDNKNWEVTVMFVLQFLHLHPAAFCKCERRGCSDKQVIILKNKLKCTVPFSINNTGEH